ncbi:S-adenosyl-L-methionine-dependent methyltransferase, partial [Jimgerdemannia flammicorona]
ILVKYGRTFDIVKPPSRRSCCFTKGYHHYVEATGSILQMAEDLDTATTFNIYDTLLQRQATTFLVSEPSPASSSPPPPEAVALLHTLRLRYFTPREVANLMGFPPEFGFPESINLKQRYRVLGNSISVRVVAELMRYLIKEE